MRELKNHPSADQLDSQEHLPGREITITASSALLLYRN